MDVTVGIGERLGCRAFERALRRRVEHRHRRAAGRARRREPRHRRPRRQTRRGHGVGRAGERRPALPVAHPADALAAVDRVGGGQRPPAVRRLPPRRQRRRRRRRDRRRGGSVRARADRRRPGRHQPGTGELPIARLAREDRGHRLRRPGGTANTVPKVPARTPSGWLEGQRDDERPVAFIGLGIMGGPMAANLVKAGFDVVGYNRSPEKVKELVEKGGRGADDVASAVREADVVITMVPDSPDVEDVTGGADGVFANAREGALYIDMSTIRPDVAVRVAEAGRAAGVRVLDAPVSGGEAGAIEGSLSIMVGRRGRGLRGGEAGARRGRQDDRPRRTGGIRPDGQGRQPAHGGGQHPAARPRRSCSSAPTASTPRRRWRCSAAGSRAAPCSTGRAPPCSPVSSSRASASPCTTRTWAS